jgi:UDPglucose 6-dehydrogenase
MKIAVIGTGYVGLVTATCFAESGNDVIGMDVDSSKVDTLTAGKVPIFEPGLQELLVRNFRESRLSFTTNLEQAIAPASIIFLAVGTPQGDDGSANLDYLWAAADDIAKTVTGPKIVVIKSTVPVGTNRALNERFRKTCKHPIDVVSNPEFMKEGAAIDDFMKPDRVVIGTRRAELGETFKELYGPFLRTEHPFLVMGPESAEMTKYAANAMLATKISFINEIANLCERTGAEINDVRRGIGHDIRIGFQFLFPGVGFGGSCFPKDVRALTYTAKQNNVPFHLMEAVEEVNEAQKTVLFRKIKAQYGSLKGLTFAIWGLAFKPRTDDIREAPALVLIDALLAEGATVRVHDPEALANVRAKYGDKLVYCDRPYGALEGADGLAVVTEWQEFRQPDFELMRRLLKQPVIFDGRNIYEPRVLTQLGFTYTGIGRLMEQNNPA